MWSPVLALQVRRPLNRWPVRGIGCYSRLSLDLVPLIHGTKGFQGLLSTRFNLHSLSLALCWPVPPWTRAPAGLLLPASPAAAPLSGAALFLNPSAVGQDSQSRPVWRRCGWVPMCCILRDAKNNSEQRSLLLAPSLLCTLHHLIQHKTAACAAGLLVPFEPRNFPGPGKRPQDEC